ncbi:Zinc/iron permease, partial [Meira miltonrushii]
DYNLGLHIGSVFILLAASLAGVLIPEVMRWLRIANVIFALRFFGGGILLSTAFVHLVAHALTYFSNSCIGELQYEATPAAIMMAAVWMMIVINFLIMRPLRRKAALAITNQQALRSTNSQSKHLHSKIKLEESELTFLEAGIIVHSIVIGITIGTSSGEGWVAFLIAILWHQFCEGLALASRIVLIPTLSTLRVWIMYLAFVITTPIGIAIGIGVRQSFNGNDRATLLAIGILTAISAGILLYSSFIQVIAHDFLHDPRMHKASWTRAFAAIFFFTLGAIAMVSLYMHTSCQKPFTNLLFLFQSVLGKWA